MPQLDYGLFDADNHFYKQGLEACFLFPTLGVGLELFVQDDVEQTY